MKTKKNVILAGLKIEMRPVLKKAEKIWKDNGEELVITAGLDGLHSAGSLHYYGYALDFRTRYFDASVIPGVAALLKKELGVEYDVIIHKTHIHVEYDRAKYTSPQYI
jgi:hypothetical protein